MKTVRVPEALAEIFAKAEEVVSRFFRDRIDDPTHGTIEIHGDRYVLLRGAALSVEFFDLVRSLYGVERHAEADEFARAILFDLAHSVGRTDARQLHGTMQLTDLIAKVSAGPVHFAHTGWAFVEISSESEMVPGDACFGVFEHPYSFESDAWVRAGRKADFPVCIMSAGYSSGWCEESYQQKMVAAELLCRAKGDATCHFVMAPPHRIEARIAEYLAKHPEIAARASGYRIPDFFARKREDEILKQRQDALERELKQTQKLEALGRLAGGIAHDFNNLISVVLGQAMLAQRRVNPSDPIAKDLSKIVRAGERAAALIQQLLAFGRTQVSRNEVLDLNAVVEETARMIERVIGEDIELTLRLAPDTGNVNADRTQLEQVLMNLALNSRDAMPGGGRLTVATSRAESDKIEIAVTDTGIGMDSETQSRAFEPFYTTKGDRGTGLGLSTVYGIVAAAGGRIDVDSAPGRGCAIRIVLPRVERSVAAAPSSAGEAQRGNSTILVVDDKVELQEFAGESLEAFGHTALLAGSGEEALKILADAEQRVDALLTDVVMPRMSGLDLAERARQLRPKLPVLFMSGHAPDPQHRALLADQRLFLQKPFAPEALAAKLTALLRKRE